MTTLLTDLVVRQAGVPAAGKRRALWDAKVPGLCLRITSSGARTWSLAYRFGGNPVPQRLTLGDYKTEDTSGAGLTLGAARKAATAALRSVANGIDPRAARADERAALAVQRGLDGPTFADLAAKWLATEGKQRAGAKAGVPWKEKSAAEFARIVRVELVPAFGKMAADAVGKKQIRALYDRTAERSQSMAQHVLAVVRLVFTWAAEEDYIDALPVFPKRGTQSKKRKRVLTNAELRAVTAALDAGITPPARPGLKVQVDTMAEAFRLMLLTAQRRGEVLSMEWSEISEEKGGRVWWTIPEEKHKSGHEQRVPLTDAAVETLKRIRTVNGEGAYLFPSPRTTSKKPWVSNPQKASERLWAKSKVKGATLHDLRRTAATRMAGLGVQRLVIGKVLGHSDSDVTGRYDKHAYDREKSSALGKWTEELDRIITDKDEAAAPKVLPWAR